MRAPATGFWILLLATVLTSASARSAPPPNLQLAAAATAAAEAQRPAEPRARVFVEQILVALDLEAEFAGVAERAILLDRLDALVGASGRRERRVRRVESAMLPAAIETHPGADWRATQLLIDRPPRGMSGGSALLLYESLDAVATRDLRELVEFLESDAGWWLTSTLEEGIGGALDAAGARAAGGLVAPFSAL